METSVFKQGLEMTKDEIITHFWEFLFETGAACEYVEAVRGSSETGLDSWHSEQPDYGYIIRGFVWKRLAIEGLDWNRLHQRWRKRLNELNNCK